MIRAGFCLYNFNSFSTAQCSQYLSNICFDLFVYYLSSIFWCKDYVILAFPFCMGVYSVPKRNADHPAWGNCAAVGGNVNRWKWESLVRR